MPHRWTGDTLFLDSLGYLLDTWMNVSRLRSSDEFHWCLVPRTTTRRLFMTWILILYLKLNTTNILDHINATWETDCMRKGKVFGLTKQNPQTIAFHWLWAAGVAKIWLPQQRCNHDMCGRTYRWHRLPNFLKSVHKMVVWYCKGREVVMTYLREFWN